MLRYIRKFSSLMIKLFYVIKCKLYKAYTIPHSINIGSTKNALVSYVIPRNIISLNKSYSHSNEVEIEVICQALLELGFNIDVYDYQSEGVINYCKYDLILGFGYPYINSVLLKEPSKKYICYLTGANPNYSNAAEALQIKRIYQKFKKMALNRREVYLPWMNSAINSDAIFVIGNSWTLSTYDGINEKIYSIPAPSIINKSVNLDLNEKKPNAFLWFGGSGSIHKGLDLVLEAMLAAQIDIILDICGPLSSERDFFSIYQKYFDSLNIKYHGMVTVDSDQMIEITSKCDFIILPSCSEGCASSVITAMSFGLIPVITKQTGIDLEDFGVSIDRTTPESVLEAMILAMNLSESDIRVRSEKAISYVEKNHSRKSVLNTFKNNLIDVLDYESV